jgi:glycosyltransferase involved in cell wall biosynthesis
MAERPIVVFSSIDWDYVWQGHHELSSRLAAKGHPVLFVENTGLRRPRLSDTTRLWRRARQLTTTATRASDPVPGLRVLAPRILPFPYSPLVVALNRRILEGPIRRWLAARPESPIVWTYLPTPLVRALAKQLSPRLLIYYCVDDLPASSALASRVAASEAELLRSADLVFVTSERLRQKAMQHRAEVHVFRPGVNYERFAAARTSQTPGPVDISRLHRPRVGYIGGLHPWFDVPLAASVARRLAHVQFVFVGPVQADVTPLMSLPNVHFIGPKAHTEVPYYLREIDVALIPYVLDEYTASVFPTKLNEYLAMGLRVVATPLPEVTAYRDRHGPMVDVASGAEGFASAISRALSEPATQGEREARYEVARSQSWDARIDAMRALMESALHAKSGRGVA